MFYRAKNGVLPVTAAVAVPDTLAELLTPAWLTAGLGLRFPGVRVTGVTPGPVVERVCTNARFTIECEGGLPPGLPAELCGKGFFAEAFRPYRVAGEPEARFYRDVAPMLPLRTLRSVYADVEPDTGHGVVITEDVVAQGATFLDGSSAYTVDLAAESLAELARLHVATWGDDRYAGRAWLASRLERQLAARGVPEIRGNFEGPIGAGVPVEVRDAERLVDRYREIAAAMHTAEPWCLVHGDPHVANVFLDGDGHPGICDWQLVQRGPWYLDVGYHLAAVLDVADRRGAEDDLVREYLDRLAAAGIDAPSWDDAWDGIRRGVVHGFFLWGITLKVDPAITNRLLERLGTAAADHGALEGT
jgi:hypothetical protein